jgi:hypothetical protein
VSKAPTTTLVARRDQSKMLNLVDQLDKRLPELAGDTNSLALGMAHITELIDALKIVQRTAGKMLCDTLPLTGHGNPVPTYLIDELGLMVERVTEGGNWTDIDWARAVADVIAASVKENGGELNMRTTAAAIVECFGFSHLKEDAKKQTGLARFGLTRGTYGTKRDATYTARIKR